MNALSYFGSTYRYMYQDESTNVSIVSVSRRAGPPHFGQIVFTNSGVDASSEPPSPVNFTSWGRITGRSLSGTATIPSLAQYTTGIGVPQYRCREMPQSFSRKIVSPRPNTFCSANAVIFAIASSGESPLYGPEFTSLPCMCSSNAVVIFSASNGSPSGGCTTTRTAKPYFLQNSRSR